LSITPCLDEVIAQFVPSEIDTTSTRDNKKKRSDEQPQDVGSSAKRSKQFSTVSADNTNRCTNRQIRINMISNTKKKFYCTVCPSVYLDRTGLYKHKIRMHPQVTKNSTEQTSSTTTTDDVSTADMDNAMREVQSTSSTQQSNNEVPNLSTSTAHTAHNSASQISLISGIDTAGIQLMPLLSTSDMDGLTTAVSNTVLTDLSKAIAELFSKGHTNHWTLPTESLTSDDGINNWLNDLSLKIIKTTMAQMSSQLTNALLEGIASGHELQKVAEFCLKLTKLSTQ